ncbi:peroxisome biogenesis 1 isoform X1 [Chlorella sorokiniana]|uniref:Peroxisomal ATPase PEX1 n=1 Tax=Chlorella sorokiniana TaxID=3076 RepID=A0A2P6TSA4_CHLSO|nr:peroxisome biogenesis 1 isoform X1 [Chlorella sorokiniana]|eukprot:PRW56943.1 peroxisome biogenesis 1 isoform X1 [Chlorella sorokiniana]
MSLEMYESVMKSGRSPELVVRLTHERMGWVALPPALCSRLFAARAATPLALELRPIRRRAGVALPSDTPCYASWVGDTCAAGCVGVPAALARALGLQEGVAVAVRPLPEAPPAVSVTVEPASEDDWEIVQLNGGFIEETLLTQVGVASPHQPLPIWIRSSGWLRPAAEAALARLLPVLGFTPRSLLQSWGAPRPGGLLVCGPAGSGKSALLAGAAAALQAHPECLTYCVTVSCREISAEAASQAQAQILPKVREALDHLPSLLVFDDLDVLCPAEGAGADGAASSADPALVAWLADLLDHLAAPSPDWGRLPPLASTASSSSNGENGNGAGGVSSSKAWPAAAPPQLGTALWPPLAVAATCRDASSLAAPLRAAGRLDHVVTLPAPTAESRAAILSAAAAARGTQLDAAHLRLVAERADGFDAADLEVLLDRALHVAVRRQLAERGSSGSSGGRLQLAAVRSSSSGGGGSSGGAAEQLQQPLLRLTREDLLEALEGFTPAAFWGTGSRKSVQAGVEGWADVGGMEEARQALHEVLELPTKHARLVAKAPLRLRTGVLLYGPPGCGKTHIVAAAVAAAGVRCITVSGPELLNKYIGASEAAVRDVFVRAAAAAPSVLFFDEFDAIAPQRGHDNTGVTDRVVNQLLTELDGVEGLRGVCVVAATSRPDLIDAALLRPGRLDRLVYCGFPSPLERGQVLRALARGVQLAPGADLDLLGYNAEFYSGADLAALLAEAQLAAVHEALEQAEHAAAAAAGAAGGGAAAAAKAPHPHPHTPPLIQQRHLDAALEAARPSVPEAERERLEAIYSRFRQDREPGGTRSAADKGKGKAGRMVKTVVEDLVQDLKQTFQEARERGEIGWRHQSGDSFSGLDERVRSAVLEAAKTPEAFDRFTFFNGEHYVRNLVYQDENFELLVLCWAPGQGSRIHNHGDSHGWVTVLRGRVEETRYTNPRANLHDDSAPPSPSEGPAAPPAIPGVLGAVTPCPQLQKLGKGVAGPGAQLYINDGQALHAVRCADDTDYEHGAVTLHLYAPPTRRVLLYEPEADRVVTRVPGFYSRGGRVVREG